MQQANLQGVLPRLAETFIRNLAAQVTRTSSRLDTLLKQALITRTQADTLYGPTAIERALQSNGTNPLNVTGLLGLLASPQQASAPKVTTLPGPNDPKSQDGALISYNSVLYRFDQTPSPGAWVPQFANPNLQLETPTGALDGVNKVFTITYAPAQNILWILFLNQVQAPTTDYSLSGTTITFTVAPKARDVNYFYALYAH